MEAGWADLLDLPEVVGAAGLIGEPLLGLAFDGAAAALLTFGSAFDVEVAGFTPALGVALAAELDLVPVFAE